jgi:hypothetical protein
MKRKGKASFRSCLHNRTLIVPGFLLLTLIGLSVLSLLIQKGIVRCRFTKPPQPYLLKELTRSPKPTTNPRFKGFDPEVISQMDFRRGARSQTAGPVRVGSDRYQLSLYRFNKVKEEFDWCDQRISSYGDYYLGAFYFPFTFTEGISYELFDVKKLGLLPFNFDGVTDGMFARRIINEKPLIEAETLTVLSGCRDNKSFFFTINPKTEKIEQIKFQNREGSVVEAIDIPVRCSIPQIHVAGNIISVIGDTFLEIGPRGKEIRRKTRYKFDLDQFGFVEVESWVQESK